ncbi:MAG: methylmalonyl-CoA mutase family protein, partial [Candidatus Dormibacterales bacterium]
ETAVPYVADPLGGSYYVEWLTGRVEEEAASIMAEVERRGGAVAVIESGWMQRRIAESAYRFQQRVESGQRTVVGVNRYQTAEAAGIEVIKVSLEFQRRQAEALRELRAGRDAAAVAAALQDLEAAARGPHNLMYPLKAALAAYATVGECADRLRAVFGEYRPEHL